MDSQQRKSATALLSVGSNTALVVGKLVVGLMIGSVSVISEAIHSGVDLVAAVIALFAVRTSGKPPDERHPFGHGKAENLAGTIEALLIFVAAGWIIYEAVRKLSHPEPLEDPGWGVAVMLISAVANMLVSAQLFRVGRETDSVALQADGWHLRTDVYTSAGVMGGLALIVGGQWLLPGVDLAWIDPVAAIAVALLIARAAWHLTREAGRDLMDTRLSPEDEDWISNHVTEGHPLALGLHGLRTRKGGATRFVEFHLEVPKDISVEQSHSVALDVARGIEDHFGNCVVTIHPDPR